jgi:hypothetical protein
MGLYRDSHAGDRRLANAVDTLIIKAGRFDNPVNVIAERVKFIKDAARCGGCGATGAECKRIRKARDGAVDCCTGGDPFEVCHHVEDRAMVDRLMREIVAGEVRTVDEAYPAPAQGPKMVTYNWLLWQDAWWYPYRRPAIRIAEMEKTHRLNTANWLERKAVKLVREQETRMALGPQPGGDMACDAFERGLDDMREHPVEWLRGTPLLQALRKGLPTKGRKLDDLTERARHWHTCPMRLRPEKRPRGPHDTDLPCACVQDETGRTVGATNDPNPVPVPPRRSSLEPAPDS